MVYWVFLHVLPPVSSSCWIFVLVGLVFFFLYFFCFVYFSVFPLQRTSQCDYYHWHFSELPLAFLISDLHQTWRLSYLDKICLILLCLHKIPICFLGRLLQPQEICSFYCLMIWASFSTLVIHCLWNCSLYTSSVKFVECSVFLLYYIL